jgi:hypothetical protein
MEIIQPLQAIRNNKQHETLSTAFNQICGNGIPFLAPQDYDEIQSAIPTVASQISGINTTDTRWDLGIIENMLEKGYNPTALEPTCISANLCVSSIKSLPINNQKISIIELGTGAGWSTLILYNILRHNFDNFVIHAIDESSYSISCTSKMLEHFGIPYQIIANGESVYSTSESRKVILYADNFISSLSQFDAKSIHAIYSNHGTAYMDSVKHADMLKIAQSILISNGIFVTDSLDPQIFMDLSKFFIISSILTGKNKTKFSLIPNEERYLYKESNDGTKILRVMRDESAANFLDWLSYLVYSGRLSIFMKYLSALRRSVSSQQIIREWVKVPSKNLHIQVSESVLAGWQSEILSPDIQVPYVQTVKLVNLQ